VHSHLTKSPQSAITITDVNSQFLQTIQLINNIITKLTTASITGCIQSAALCHSRPKPEPVKASPPLHLQLKLPLPSIITQSTAVLSPLHHRAPLLEIT
jgi:hypothetical protein